MPNEDNLHQHGAYLGLGCSCSAQITEIPEYPHGEGEITVPACPIRTRVSTRGTQVFDTPRLPTSHMSWTMLRFPARLVAPSFHAGDENRRKLISGL